MKFRQSSIPFLLLLAILSIGIPYGDHQLKQSQKTTITHTVHAPSMEVASLDKKLP